MEQVRIDDVDNAYGPAAVKRRLTRPLGATDVAVNYYELAPGDSFAFGYHGHAVQEEVFVVLTGTVTFETEDGPVEVGADEAVRFAPGEFQRGVNEGSEPRSDGSAGEGSESEVDERVRAFAIGAPKDGETTAILRECSGCGERTPQAIELAPDGDALVSRCEDCGGSTGRFVHGEVDRGEEP